MTLTPAGADEDDPLAPEPANLTGALIGYARVSTSGQILDRQTRALTNAGCIRVFADKLSGKTADRPELAAYLDYLRKGDTREGLDAAHARGQRLGRPPAMIAEQIRLARDLLTLPGNSISSIARLLGVSRATIYKYLPELADGYRPPTGQNPTPRPGLPALLAITAPPTARSHAGSGDNAASGRMRCDAGQVTGSDRRHLADLTEAHRTRR